jgi:type VI secretion system secreted protein Hcp
MEIRLEDASVSSVSPTGCSQDDESVLPTETLSFTYERIQWTYTQQRRPDGSAGGNVSTTWDLGSRLTESE